MRILSLPIAILLAACVYIPFRRTAARVADAVRALYGRFLLLFTRKSGKTDEQLAFPLFLLVFGGACQLIGGLHMLLAALVLAPVFSALSLLPQAARAKEELDSGALSSNIAEYEAKVRSLCAALGPAFATDMVAPMLLYALGAPIHMGCVLTSAYLAARALHDAHPAAMRTVRVIGIPCAAVTRGLLLLCSCVVGKNPLHAKGDTLRELMLSILDLTTGSANSRDPVAGDITQAVFLLCFVSAFLCAALVVALVSFC